MGLDFNRLLKCVEGAKKDYLSLVPNCKKIAKAYADRFYNEYTPVVYVRGFNFYNIPVIKKKEGCLITDYDVSLLNHGGLNNYIFEYMYKRGWHGGEIDGVDSLGKPHPNEGIPYWLKETPLGLQWYKPAFNTTDGSDERFEELENSFDNCVLRWENNLSKDLDNCIEEANKILEELNKLL